MAALSTIAAIATIGASAFSVGKSLTEKGPKTPTVPDVTPAAPDPNAAADAIAAALSRKKGKAAIGGGEKSGRASTLLSGASGLVDRAPTERKTLLGQ